MGMPPYVTFVVAICISQLCLAGRLYILRNMMDFQQGSLFTVYILI